MAGVTTPAKDGTAAKGERDLTSGPRSRSEWRDYYNSTTPPVQPSLDRTPSTNSSSGSNNSSTFDGISRAGTPLTPPLDEDDTEIGSGSSPESPTKHRSGAMGSVRNGSPTPKNVSREELNTEAKQHSAGPRALSSASNDNDLRSERSKPDGTKEGNPPLKRPRRDDSLAPPKSVSEGVPLEVGNDTPITSIAESQICRPFPDIPAAPLPKDDPKTTARLATSSQGETVGSPAHNIFAAALNPQKGRSNRKAKGGLRGTPNNRQNHAVKANDSETTTPIPGTQKSDEDETIISEHQASTTSGQAPVPAAREANVDTTTAEGVDAPLTKTSENSDADTGKSTGNIKFEQYESVKSLNDIKIAILDVILQEDEKHSLDKEEGFVYMYQLDSFKGHIKIGKTKIKHGQRVEQWAKACNLPFKRISDHKDKRFLHYGIVEKLVHVELSNKRKKYKCGTCTNKSKEDAKRNHCEWFEVAEKEALEVAERWRGWLVQHQPYRKDGSLRGIWVWKHRMLSEANTVDLKDWPILTWHDWSGYAWYMIDSYLDEQVPAILRSSLSINMALIYITYLWWTLSFFLSTALTMIIMSIFFKYS